MMFYNGNGQPDPNGRFQLIDGKLKLRASGGIEDGQYVGFDMAFMDSVAGKRFFRDGDTTQPPKSIDEALQREFALRAKGQNLPVREMLAKMTQGEIASIASEVASQFVAEAAANGVASTFSKDSAMMTDAEAQYRVAAARRKHELMHPGKPFTADMAAAALGKAAAGNLVSSLQTADSASEIERLRSEADGARIARKHVLSNRWRG